MTHTFVIKRPPKDLVEGLAKIGSAMADGELSRLGIRDAHIRGPSLGRPARRSPGLR